jgi:tetratricopeptide (TPR) repeat protein
MTREGTKKEMTKEQINSKLEKFSTTSEKIKYLQSVEPKAKLLKKDERNAFYEKLGDLMGKKGDLSKMAAYYHKAGRYDLAKRIWEKEGDVDILYYDRDKAIEKYGKANAAEKREQVIRKKEMVTLGDKFLLVLSFGSFLCAFIFLSGRITGNTILDASFKTSNLIGALLFIVGVVASFFYFEKRK